MIWRTGIAFAAVVATALVFWGAKESWGTDVCLGVAALYISIGGFVIAIAEIRRAQSVSHATRRAIQRTLKGVRAGRLGITITQIRQTVSDFEQAIIDQDAVGARRAINAWAYLAAEARGPIAKRFPERNELMESLNRSLELGHKIKPRLAEAEGQSLWSITEETLGSMVAVSNELAALLEELMPMIEDEQ